VDLPATLLDLLGMPASGLDGESLRPALEAGRLGPRSSYAETFYPRFHFGWSELTGVTDDRYHFIRAPRPELYDRKTDAGERDNLAAQRPEAVAAMEAWLQRTVGSAEPAAPEAVPSEVSEALRALGYVGSGSRTSAAADRARADPKDKLAVYEAYREAAARRLAGDHAAAVAALRGVLAQEPEMSDAWEDLGASLLALGHAGEAVAALERAVAIDPGRAAPHLALARALALTGKPDAAMEHATAASAQDPGAAFELVAEVRLARGELAPAADAARRSLAADPQRATAAFVLGVVEQRGGRCAEAIEAFRRAAAAQSRQKRLVIPGLHARWGDCLARLDRAVEAENEFRVELAQIPYTREGRVGLALLLQSQGRGAEVREVLAGIVTAHPRPGADEYWTVVRTLAVLGDRPAAGEWAARAHRLFPRDARFSASRPS
jgi:tetratricopeptide (TPR) repeat protein